MIDENYKAAPGRLSDKDILYLCMGDKPMISPFLAKQVGRPSAGLSSAGYDLRLGERYFVQNTCCLGDEFFVAIDPLNVNHQEDTWTECVEKSGEIVIYPNGCILTETMETIDMPDDVVATVLGKSTYARNNIIVNATPLEPGWRGVVTLEIHNCSSLYAVVLRVGCGIAQVVFDRMPNPPSRTYGERETAATYQDQKGVTTSR